MSATHESFPPYTSTANAEVVIAHIKKAPVETGAMVDYFSGIKLD
jgi:hypothetical protein